MTLLSYEVTFDSGQMETVKKALDHYLDVCRREIRSGGSVPFISDRLTIKRLLARLRKHAHVPTHIDDGELFALQDALSNYSEACEQGIASGEAVPFTADRSTIKIIFGLLDDAIERTYVEAAQRNADQ